MAIWSIVAAPLIMGNDMRNVSAASMAILTNAHAIAVNQDPLGQMGLRLENSSTAPTQRWARVLANGDVAVALYNKAGSIVPPIPGPPCDAWTHTTGGYYESCAGNIADFSGQTLAATQEWCCASLQCAGFSWDPSNGGGYYKLDAQCGITKAEGYEGYTKPSQIPSGNATAQDITISFADVNLHGPVAVFDIWAGATVGTFTGNYTATAVPYGGSAFLRLSSA